jgi:hypothetical protein
MALRSLLGRLAQDPAGVKLISGGGRAFVSSAMRPYAIAAVLDAAPDRPGLVVAGDDREAQELADDYLVMERGEFIDRGQGQDMQAKGVRQLVAI